MYCRNVYVITLSASRHAFVAPKILFCAPSFPPLRRCYENCSFVVTAKCSPLPAVDISCLPFLTSQNVNLSQTVIVNPKVWTLSVWFSQCIKYLNSVYLWTSSIINHQTASLSVYARFCVICILSMFSDHLYWFFPIYDNKHSKALFKVQHQH